MTQIAFTGDIAFTKYFSNSCDDKNLLDKRQIQEIKAKNRWCIVVSHVGQEFS